ncbi:BTB and MATH domain-containing protein 36 [Aphelenchoides avenae]|nr:BTB and MATH domain-containing protein 36 [Aphelenchus avenae]
MEIRLPVDAELAFAVGRGDTGDVSQKHFGFTWTLSAEQVCEQDYNVCIHSPVLPKGFTWSSKFYERINGDISYYRPTYGDGSYILLSLPDRFLSYFAGVELTLKWPDESGWQFGSGEKMRDADVTLTVDGSTFYAHRAMLSFGSPVFAKMFNGEYREMRQPLVNITVVEGVDALGFEAFLRCVYPINGEELDDGFLVQLAILADYYDVKALFEKCRDRLKASTTISKVEKMKVALRVNDHDLEESVMESLTPRDISEFINGELSDQLGEERLKKMIQKLLSSFE